MEGGFSCDFGGVIKASGLMKISSTRHLSSDPSASFALRLAQATLPLQLSLHIEKINLIIFLSKILFESGGAYKRREA